MIKQCEKEVIDLHKFFEQWFKAEIENTDQVFSRLENALATDFELIVPSGEVIPRDKLLKQLRSGYGSRKDDRESYKLWIEEIEIRFKDSDICLVTYQEWAEVQGKQNARISSALFKISKNAVNEVEWVHVHETSIPIER